MNQDLELKLQAWVDGELSATEARRISEEIAGDAEAGQLVAELQAVKKVIAGNEMALTVPETREFYWSKIEREIQRDGRSPREVQTPRRAGWLRWLAPLSGFTALACILLLAVKPAAPSSFDEITSTDGGMEAVTFHDQSAGMTVVWLGDTDDTQPMDVPEANIPDTGNSEVEME